MRFFRKTAGQRPPRSSQRRARPSLEELESRLVPYATSGNAWPAPERVTISFVPDGTVLGTSNGATTTSNLFATLNAKFGSASAWQNTILKAAQAWAQQTNVNFDLTSDNGSDLGSGNYQQGDTGTGDIRIGGYNFGSSTLAMATLPPPINNQSSGGDVNFNTAQPFNIGTTYDLFTVATHEVGHTLGLYHTGIITADMYGTYFATKTGLALDDVSAIRSTYSAGAARSNT